MCCTLTHCVRSVLILLCFSVDEIQATPVVRPKDLNLNLEDQAVKEENEEHGEVVELDEPRSVEEETPQTDCTVVSCVSRGASCTPSEIRRSLLVSLTTNTFDVI